jgi:hypothetical protein
VLVVRVLLGHLLWCVYTPEGYWQHMPDGRRRGGRYTDQGTEIKTRAEARHKASVRRYERGRGK